jgi:PST family polysaccharide transporter
VIVIPTVLIAPLMITILYGPEYAEATAILRIHIWSYLFVSIGVARQRWLIAENQVKFSMFATILGAIVNILLNFWLIPAYAGLGSAWATLISYGVSAFLSTVFFKNLWPLFGQLNRSLLIPFRLPELWKSIREVIP